MSNLFQQMYPKAIVYYNDYDNFIDRLEDIDDTNYHINNLKAIIKTEHGKRITEEEHERVVNYIKNNDIKDKITVLGGLMMSSKKISFDYENINYDLSEYIKDITNYIKNNPILANCGKIVSIDIEEKKKLEKLKKETDTHYEYHEHHEYYEEQERNYKEKKEKDPFRKFYKYSLDENDKLLIIVNITSKTRQLDTKEYGIKEDISFENKIENITETIDILPYQLKIFAL